MLKKPIVLTPVVHLEFPDLKEIWKCKGLLIYLVRRDLKIRFQQTFIGVFWIVLQPIVQLLIFYIIFGLLVRFPTDGIPYSVYYMSGYVVWQLFNQIINTCATSLTANIGVITKIYFPRLILPLSTTVGALIDFFITFLILLIFLFMNKYVITARYLLIPFILLITMIFSLGVGLLFGALMVVFRDTKNFLAYIIQIWMFLSPIFYAISSIPEDLRILFYINPLTGIIDTFRWICLGTSTHPSFINLGVSSLVAIFLLFIGMVSFRSMENQIADVM
ncbi:MAG: ABC transporter permease [Bacteroidales bacterium]